MVWIKDLEMEYDYFTEVSDILCEVCKTELILDPVNDEWLHINLYDNFGVCLDHEVIPEIKH